MPVCNIKEILEVAKLKYSEVWDGKLFAYILGRCYKQSYQSLTPEITPAKVYAYSNSNVNPFKLLSLFSFPAFYVLPSNFLFF